MGRVWETTGLFDQIDSKARIIGLDGEYTLEVMVKEEANFFKRLKNALKYLFHGKGIGVGSFFLGDEDIEALRRLEDNDDDADR